MPVISDTQLDKRLNYHQLKTSHPSYLYRNVYPANGGARTISLTSAGETQTTIFNIPVEVVNLGESYLEYTLTINDQGANNFAWMFKDGFYEYDYLTYRDSGTQRPVEVRYFEYYQNLMNKWNWSKDKIEYSDEYQGIVKTNAPLTDVKCKSFDNTVQSQPFIQAQELEVGPQGDGVGAGNIVKTRKIYLKDLIPDSLFGLAKNTIMPVETYLEINWIGSMLGFQSTSGTNPTQGTAPLAKLNNYAVQLDGIVLKLAFEQNQNLVKSLKEEVAKGMTLPIPWVTVHKIQAQSVAPWTYNLPLDNKQHGQKIKRIIYAPYVQSANNQYNELYNHSNTSATTGYKITRYYTELDNQKLQRDEIKAGNLGADDYMLHKNLLRHTLMYDSKVYNQYWSHNDSFEYNETNYNKDGYIMIDGYDLVKPVTYSVNVVLGVVGVINPTNVAIVCGQKLLVVNQASFVVQ
jgi:hypothetical protein